MEVDERKEIARYLLSKDDLICIQSTESVSDEAFTAAVPKCTTMFDFAYPDGLKPIGSPLAVKPDKGDSLPKADIVIITWTAAEADALADIFTCPYHRPVRSEPSQKDWYQYSKNFETKFKDQIRKGAPSRGQCDDVNLLGSYFPCKVGTKNVLCFKSELHLNQDGKKTGKGTATLPVKDLFKQIIEESQPSHILTTGTCGATYLDHELGDVVVTKSAKFRCSREFRNEHFNHKIYESNWDISTKYFTNAESFMQQHGETIQEPKILPPTIKFSYTGSPIPTKQNKPNIFLEGSNLPNPSPILTTDYFEFGNSTNNNLQNEGCGVEMGDAALGLLCSELGDQAPKWAVIRNLSDPVINGNLREDPKDSPLPRIMLQSMWATWYYDTYGYYTSINSALTTWAIIAGI